MARLTLFTHPKAEGVFFDPSTDGINDDLDYTPAKVASALGITPAALNDIISAGTLRVSRNGGGRTVVSGQDLARFVDRLRPVEFREVGASDDAEDEDEDEGRSRNRREASKKPKKLVRGSDEDEEAEEQADEAIIIAPLGAVRRMFRGLLTDQGEDQNEEQDAARKGYSDDKSERPWLRRFFGGEDTTDEEDRDSASKGRRGSNSRRR